MGTMGMVTNELKKLGIQRESNPLKRIGNSANIMVHDPKFYAWLAYASGGLAGAGGAGAVDAGTGAGADAGAAAEQQGGRLGGIIKGVGKYAPLVMGGLSGIEAYQQNKRASDLQNEGLNIARADREARAPLLQMGMNGIQNAQRPDLSAMYADPGNPYARRIPRVGGIR